MTIFKTNWIAGNVGHITEHNKSGYVLNDILSLRMFDPHPDLNSSEARAENSAAFVAALAAAQRIDTTYHESSGIYIPPGDYYLDAPIVIQNHWGLKLYSHGRGARLLWRGGDDAAIKILNSRECVISNLAIMGETTGSGVQLARVNYTDLTPSHNVLEQVEIEGFADSVLIGGAETIDANNDFNRFEHCVFRDYRRYGVNLEGSSQSFGNLFTGCVGSAYTSEGQALIKTGVAGGTFEWHGGSGNGNTVADFIIGRHYQGSVVRFFVSEGSARFIQSEIGATYFNLLIESCRWAGNALHADLKSVKIDTVGIAHVSIRNSKIGDGNNPTVGTLIDFSPSQADETLSSFEFVNDWVFSSAVDVFSGRSPTSKIGGLQVTDEEDFTVQAL